MQQHREDQMFVDLVTDAVLPALIAQIPAHPRRLALEAGKGLDELSQRSGRCCSLTVRQLRLVVLIEASVHGESCRVREEAVPSGGARRESRALCVRTPQA